EQLQLVVPEDRPDEFDIAREAKLEGKTFERAFLGSSAGDGEPGLQAQRARGVHGLEQFIQALLARQPADIRDLQPRLRIGFGRARAQERAVAVAVDRIGDYDYALC